MKAFQIGSTKLGFLASVYFYSTVIFLLPAGYLLDRFSPKKVILLTLALSIVGIVGFATAHDYWIAAAARFIEGIASSFCFLGCLKIASNWVAKKYLAVTTGLIMMVALLGGYLASAPLTYLIDQFQWRQALLIDAAAGCAVFLLISFIVDDHPHPLQTKNRPENGYWPAFKQAVTKASNWACGLYTCLMNLPMMLLGAIWGSLFLTQIYAFSPGVAAQIVGMIFLGTIAGSPIVGWLSDFFGKRKIIMIVSAILSFCLLIVIIYTHKTNHPLELTVFFLLGVFSSAQILGYPTAAQNDKLGIPAMSASIVSFTTMSGYIVFQPLFGFLMDISGPHTKQAGITVYQFASYETALWIIPVGLVVAIAAILFIKTPEQTS